MSKYDLRAYLRDQEQEAYRAFVVHAPAMGHKTALAREMRDKLGAHLLDLQAYFVEHPDLAARIDTFRPEDLKVLLFNLDVPDVPSQVVVVDNIDFLLNTWSPGHLRQLVAMIDRGWRSPGDTTKTFVFFVQSDSLLARQNLRNNRGQPRVLPLDAFYVL